MEFLQPWGVLAFLAPAAVLALYFLRRKYVETHVSSTLLWRRTVQDLNAAHPFQRLKKNPLMLLQLLIALLLALALTRPAIGGQIAGETVMIFDCSASMQAKENGKTRMEAAVEQAKNEIAALSPKAPLTILTAGSETRQLLSRSTDRTLAREALNSIAPGNTAGDLTASLSLARAMNEELSGVWVIVYSDTYVPSPGVEAVNCAGGAENRAVLSLAALGGAAVARIANYGNAGEFTAECTADGALCDARRFSAEAGETVSVRFSVPENAAVLCVRLTDGDAVSSDDAVYHILREDGETVIVLDGNDTFLEHALALRSNVHLLRADQSDWNGISHADLYIRESGEVIFSRSPELPDLPAGTVKTPESALSIVPGADALTRHLSLDDTAFKQYRSLSGGTPFLRCGEDTVGAFGPDWVALGFDPHDSNLPLKYDFPIMIQNILQYLCPPSSGVSDGICGQKMNLHAAGTVETPSGRRIEISENSLFADTEEAGLYILRTAEGETPFALTMDFSESDVREAAPSLGQSETRTITGRREITRWLLLAAFLLLLLEGGISRRVGAY
ncbi:MAG: VWA domain-containing protein [Clostridia bacterium]|nr:VWA domain-containing protein [Clostridia bacterium]